MLALLSRRTLLLAVTCLYGAIAPSAPVYAEPSEGRAPTERRDTGSPAEDGPSHRHFEVLAAMSLEEILGLKVEVEVASLFQESDLVVGSAVAAIPEENWRSRGAQLTTDAISHLPGVVALPTFGGGSAIAIRGYATELSVRGTATRIDGVPMNTFSGGTAQYTIPNFNLGTLDRIEMIRGPGSALYGSDAFHGVFSMKTFQSPRDVIQAEAEAGTLGRYHGWARGSYGPLDSLRVNAALAYAAQPDQHRSYRYSQPSPGRGERAKKLASLTGVVKLELDPREDVSMHFGFYADSWRGDRFPGAGQHIPQFGDLQDRDWTDSDATLYMGKGALAWRLPADVELELNGFYWENEHLLTFDLTRGAGGLLEQRADEHRGGLNLLVRQPDNFLNTQWVASYGYDRMQIDAGAYKNKGRDIHSFFFQGKTSLPSDFAHLLYAVRVDDYSDFGTQVTPRAGLIIQPTQESAVKLLYGRAFRAPVASELYGTSAAPVENPDIGPETIDTVELLLLLERPNWKGELGGFWSRWSDGIAVVAPTYENRDKSESWGVEASFRYAFKGWSADLSGSYVMSENETESRDYVAFPKYILNLGLGYDWQELDLHFYLITRIQLAAKEYPIIDSLPYPDDLKNYYRTDLKIDKGIGESFEIWLTARNLFNRKNYFPAIWNAEGGIPDEPFNVSLGVRWSFE